MVVTNEETLADLRAAAQAQDFTPPTTDVDAKYCISLSPDTVGRLYNWSLGRFGLRINGRLRKKHGIPCKRVEPVFSNWMRLR